MKYGHLKQKYTIAAAGAKTFTFDKKPVDGDLFITKITLYTSTDNQFAKVVASLYGEGSHISLDGAKVAPSLKGTVVFKTHQYWYRDYELQVAYIANETGTAACEVEYEFPEEALIKKGRWGD